MKPRSRIISAGRGVKRTVLWADMVYAWGVKGVRSGTEFEASYLQLSVGETGSGDGALVLAPVVAKGCGGGVAGDAEVLLGRAHFVLRTLGADLNGRPSRGHTCPFFLLHGALCWWDTTTKEVLLIPLQGFRSRSVHGRRQVKLH